MELPLPGGLAVCCLRGGMQRQPNTVAAGVVAEPPNNKANSGTKILRALHLGFGWGGGFQGKITKHNGFGGWFFWYRKNVEELSGNWEGIYDTFLGFGNTWRNGMTKVQVYMNIHEYHPRSSQMAWVDGWIVNHTSTYYRLKHQQTIGWFQWC